jgi:hypothetical protein
MFGHIGKADVDGPHTSGDWGYNEAIETNQLEVSRTLAALILRVITCSSIKGDGKLLLEVPALAEPVLVFYYSMASP